MSPFAGLLQRHQAAWARSVGLGDCVESSRGLPWVLADEHRKRNVHREEWWRHIEGREHRWARALNSSQCFAVNLFAPLADDARAAHAFLGQMLPERALGPDDRVELRFEHTPPGVAEGLGERGQPTQIDVFFSISNARGLRGAVGVEVKLSEREFGVCRGWHAVHDRVPINPARERCLNASAVREAPQRQCFMTWREGRRYWEVMARPGASFDLRLLGIQDGCPFRHGLYQLMRNRAALDVLRSLHDLEFSDFAVCVHPLNQAARRLPEAVVGSSDALEAFQRLAVRGAVREWDPRAVVDAVVASGAAPPGWAEWMKSRYLLAPADADLSNVP